MSEQAYVRTWRKNICSRRAYYHSLMKEHPPPYFWPNFLYRVKVYFNECPPWSKLRVGVLVESEKYIHSAVHLR